MKNQLLRSQNVVTFLTISAFGLFVILSSFQCFAFDDETESGASENVLYNFHEHLFSADAISIGKKKDVTGVWKEDRFIFSELPAESQIKLVNEEKDELQHSYIRFNPIENMRRRLTFRNVPNGSTIVFHYQLNQSLKTTKSPYLILRIKAGKKLLKSLRLFQQNNEWNTESISLGPAAFLNHDLSITVEISSEVVEGLQFNFYAEVLP